MKEYLRNLKLSKKILCAPLIIIFFLIVLSGVAYRGISDQRGTLGEYQRSSKIINDMTTAHAHGYRLLNWIGAEFDKQKIEDLKKEQMLLISENIKALQAGLNDGRMDPDKRRIFQACLDGIGAYQKGMADVLDMASVELRAAIVLMRGADDKFQVLSKGLHELLAFEDRQSGQKYRQILGVFLIVLVVAVVFSLLASILMTRLIAKPIRETMNVIKQVAEGDLTKDVSSISKDEIGQLAQSVNMMRQNVSTVVGESLATSQLLSEAASNQAASLEETSASLDEMASMIKQCADNTAVANNHLSFALGAIEEVNVSVMELTKSMKEITDSSKQTQNIIKNIDGIAFQTNLLALNAAVEAARAGEAGAGFAVVAEEVRNLAMRTAESARTTSDLIEDIVCKVRNGENLVLTTGGAFGKVMESSTKVVQIMKEIDAASREQALGIDQINGAVAEMSRVTQQNATSAEKLAATMSVFKIDDQEWSPDEGPPEVNLPSRAATPLPV